MMNPAAILPQDTSHPGMPGAAFGLSVCPSLLSCAQAGVIHSHLWGCTHPPRHPSIRAHYYDLCIFLTPCRDIPSNTEQELIHQVLFFSYCLLVTPPWTDKVLMSIHNTTRRNSQGMKPSKSGPGQHKGLPSKSWKVLPFPIFCPFNHPCHFSKEFGHSYTEMP